jgi:L-ascorbate metabolism protein UlaG (beta-lactamase superfamily)
MRRLTTIIVMSIAIQICYSSSHENKVRSIEVTYIANDGFLIKVNDKKILIDALFGDKDYGFCDIPTEETMNSILKNEDYFKDIDLIATTHAHVDHFYPPFVIEHLINNTKGKFISCKQTIEILKTQENYEKFKNNLIEITPEYFTYLDTTINSIGVRVYRLTHGPYYTDDPVTGEKINRHQNVQNLGFLFNVDGIKVFHTGDSDENGIAEYEQFRLDKENIDIAFLGRGFIWNSDSKGISLVKNYINAKQIVLMHIHQDEYNEFNEIANKLKNELGRIKIFKNKMESETYVFE